MKHTLKDLHNLEYEIQITTRRCRNSQEVLGQTLDRNGSTFRLEKTLSLCEDKVLFHYNLAVEVLELLAETTGDKMEITSYSPRHDNYGFNWKVKVIKEEK